MIYFLNENTHAALRPPDPMSQTFLASPKIRLHMISLAVLAGWGTCAYGLGFGPIAVQSALTQPFSATVPVYGLSGDGASQCVKSRLQNPDGSFLSRGTARIVAGDKNGLVELGSVDSVNEPALRVELEVGCTTAVKRVFDVLLDPLTPGSTVAALVQAKRPKKSELNFSLPLPFEPPLAALPPVRKEPVSILKISGPETIADRLSGIELIKPNWELKADSVLSLSRSETSEEQMAIWRTEQSRLAAVLRGEDPMEELSQRAGAAEQQAKQLKKDSLQAAQKAAAEKAALQEEVDSRFGPAWVFSLGALALACLGGLGVVGYKRRSRKEPAAPWHRGIEPNLVTPEKELSPSEATLVSALVAPEMIFVHPEPVEMTGEQKDAESLRQAASLNAEMAQCAADVAGILCDAEHWMAEQDPASAIAALRPYFEGKQHSPAPALYLLELYRAMGDENAYAAVRAEVAATFTVLTPGWTVDWMQEAHTIAAFPAIREAIDALDGSPELLPLLQGLLLVDDSRFDFNVYRDIVREIIRAVEPPSVAAAPAVVEVAPAAELDPVPPTPSVDLPPQPIVPMEGAPLLEDDLFASSAPALQTEFGIMGEEVPDNGQALALLPDMPAFPQDAQPSPESDDDQPKQRFDLPDLDFPIFHKPDSPRMH